MKMSAKTSGEVAVMGFLVAGAAGAIGFQAPFDLHSSPVARCCCVVRSRAPQPAVEPIRHVTLVDPSLASLSLHISTQIPGIVCRLRQGLGPAPPVPCSS